MYTITLPDANGSETSPYYTYYVAVGSGALDHTLVIEWYSKEGKVLMHGKEYSCGLTHTLIHLKMGVVTVLSNCL